MLNKIPWKRLISSAASNSVTKLSITNCRSRGPMHSRCNNDDIRQSFATKPIFLMRDGNKELSMAGDIFYFDKRRAKWESSLTQS